MDDREGRAVLDRVEQRRRYGLDCGDTICFQAGSWAPGGEHVRQITVRNVSQRTIKFKYELPRTKYFSMNFPLLITLSPGMLTTLDVAFRPVKLEEYDDFVVFHVHVIEGGVTAVSERFRVPVLARIAALNVELPHGVDFGFCPTKETTVHTFVLHNCGQIDALFNWTVPTAGEHGSPFAVRPETGRIKAGTSIELTASFSPTSASVYVMTTACTVKADTTETLTSTLPLVKTMKISGISKFTHLSASETELNFGDVLVGALNTSRTPTEKEFILRNRSLVRASFRIERVENDHEPRFFFTPSHGVVDAESTFSIKVRYIPLSAGTFTCDHFDIVTPGGNRVRMTCKGRAIGPVLSVWRKNLEATLVPTRSINFQDVRVGQKMVSRALTLRNESSIDLYFHIDAQTKGVFRFDRVAAKIPPFLDLNVTISFSPPHSGNFYRRFFLLVHNQSTQYVDVMGTGYDDKMRPSPFQQAHVDAYRLRAAAGLGRLSPDQLETLHEETGDAMFFKGAVQRAKTEDEAKGSEVESCVQQLPSSSRILARSGEASLADVEVSREYFISVEDKTNPVVVLTSLLDFGSCSIVQCPLKKLLHVTNNTHSKVTCSWRVAVASESLETSEEAAAFQIFPVSSDIAAGATAEFRVAFQPSQANTYYFAELEGFAAFKSNRTFRLVNVDTFTPPWSVVVKACGNTFSSLTEQFVPNINFRLMKNKVEFPPCYLGDSVFQTILIENASDTPALFSFVEDPAAIFSCKPMCGYIAAKSFHLVALRFMPRNVQQYFHFLHFVVNNARTQPEVLGLSAICALPQLSVQDLEVDHLLPAEAKVYIKPTSVGLESRKHIELLNTSRVPLVYRCELPSKHQKVFSIKPKLGRLNGRETTLIECVFTPDEIREYASRFLVLVKSISVPLDEHNNPRSTLPVLQELTVRVQTKSTTGAIVFQPESLTLETILVNSNSKQTFSLVNTADCDLTYSLQQATTLKARHFRQGGIVHSEGNNGNGPAGKLMMSQAEGCIPAQSRKKITATFYPTCAGVFTFEISCLVGNQTTSSPYDVQKAHGKQATCIIRAEASFPTIEIQDVRVPGVSTHHAWYQFQCNEINEYLAAPPTPSENEHSGRSNANLIEINVPSVPESDELDDELVPKRFALPFTPAPFGSRSEKLFVKLCNPGGLVVQFHLRYPKESDVEIEHWAKTGAPSNEELRLDAIVDSKVFSISPRHATLLPHQSVVVVMSYSYTSHAYDGKHDLPLFLQVDKGKKMVLELQGRTLTHEDPKLFVPTTTFRLSPVTLGEFRRDCGCPAPWKRDVVPTTDDKCVRQLERPTPRPIGGPPVQQIEVFNRGDNALRLDIGSDSFDQVNASNYEYPVLGCSTSSAIVPAKSSIFLDLEFNPIQVGTIHAPLLLEAHGLMGQGYKEEVEITIVATGFHPSQRTIDQVKNELVTSRPPTRQALRIPDFPACFVADYVDFGHVSMHSEVSRLVILQHESTCESSPASPPRSFKFEWDLMHPLVANGVITFSPKRGTLGPGENALIRVSVTTASDAFVVNHDVACVITFIDENYDSNSNNSTTCSGTRGKGQQASLTRPSPSCDRDNKTRTSVVNRSIATQEAVVDKRRGVKVTAFNNSNNGTSPDSSRKVVSQLTRKGPPDTGAMSRNNNRHVQALDSMDDSISLFVRICAHVLSLDAMERIYPHEELKKLPLPITKEISREVPVLPIPSSKDVKAAPSLSSIRHSNSSTRVGRELASSIIPTHGKDRGSSQPDTATNSVMGDEAAAATCRDVLYDVMEDLVMDVLTSSTIQDALKEQLIPLSRSDRALGHARALTSANVIESHQGMYYKARQDDDCQAIVAGVMENTVFNVLQELFYGDLEQELLCVPRKSVFPNVSRPAVDARNDRNINESLLKT